MFERFSEAARLALFAARLEVTESASEEIAPEHLLLGLLEAKGGIAASLTQTAGIDAESVRQRMLSRATRPLATSVEVPFAQATKEVLDVAAAEADAMCCTEITTGHLLLGLMRDDSSSVATLLREANLRLDDLRAAVQARAMEGATHSSRLLGRISSPSRRMVLHAVTSAVVSAWPSALLARQDPDAGRDAWQRVPDLLAAMRMRERAHVADVGAGGGFITRRLAAAAGPAGRVYAVEIDARIAERLQKRMQDEALDNVEVLRGLATDPGLPTDRLDAIIVVDAYHEFTEYAAMLAAFRRALRRGGRLVVCDNASRLPTRDAQVKWHGIAPRLVKEELEEAGFHLVSVDEEFTARGSSRKALVIAER